MKIFVVFGATSDEKVYGPLVQSLQKHHQVKHAVISAHRNPEELGQALRELDYDVVVAGAGLAAHLPGVVASQIYRPVVGVAVKAAFGGLDAFCSVWQMPYGVPVLTCFPEGFPHMLSMLEGWQKLRENKMAQPQTLRVVAKDPALFKVDHVQKELQKTVELGKVFGWELSYGEKTSPTIPNLLLMSKDEDEMGDSLSVHVPVLTMEELNQPLTVLRLLPWFQRGGLWVGANNIRNAFLGVLQMFPQGSGSGSDFETKLKGVRQKTIP